MKAEDITPRDLFAICALIFMNGMGHKSKSAAAMDAYEMADVMMQAREIPPEELAKPRGKP